MARRRGTPKANETAPVTAPPEAEAAQENEGVFASSEHSEEASTPVSSFELAQGTGTAEAAIIGRDLSTQFVENNGPHRSSSDVHPAVTLPFFSFAAIFQAFIAEWTVYSKKSIDNSLVFVEDLVRAKSLDSAIQIQTDYAKTSYEGFVAQTTKLRKFYFSLTRLALRPIQMAISGIQASKS